MGFWDAVKSVATSAKCATGWHAGSWEHDIGNPECHKKKVCPDCNKLVKTKKHQFSSWEKQSYSTCNSNRTCNHCGHIEAEIRHDYNPIGKDENCHIIEKCKDCGDKKTGRADHEWVTLFNHEMKVNGKRKCKRCHFQEK